MTLQFPSENTDNFVNSFIMTPVIFNVATNRNTKNQRVGKFSKTTNTIILPTPSNGINLQESGSWDETDGYQHGMSKQGLKDFFTKGLVKKAKEGAGPLGNAMAKGVFINDYASLAYQGSNFREFTFNWVLIPKSVEEAEVISKIIKRVRFYSLPNYKATNQKTATIGFPWMWDVTPSAGNEHIFRIKDCVVTNININYTPEGVLKTYSSNHPIYVELEVTFKELYRATDGDVESTDVKHLRKG